MNKFFYKILVCFIIITFSRFSPSLCDDFIEKDDLNIKDEITAASAAAIDANSSNQIIEPQINSRSAVVIDRNSGTILYGKNENQKRKMASTTKIMTAIIIIENCNLNDTTIISKKAASTGGSRLGLKTGNKVSINDLLYGLLLRSGNDAAVALAEYCSGNVTNFAIKMNEKASELNLKDTHFETPHGLDSEAHYTTAYELATLANYAMKNTTFKNIVGTKLATISINGCSKQLSNTNELLGNFEGIYGVKTGFTNGANRCLVTACKRQNMDIICVVLGADTKKFRTQDSVKLLNYVFNNFEIVNIEKIITDNFKDWKIKNLSNIIINKSCSNSNLDLSLGEISNKNIPVRKDLIGSIIVNVNCSLYFESPVAKGCQLGNIEAIIGDKKIVEVPIFSNCDIKKKNWNNYFLELLKKYSNILNNVFIF